MSLSAALGPRIRGDPEAQIRLCRSIGFLISGHPASRTPGLASVRHFRSRDVAVAVPHGNLNQTGSFRGFTVGWSAMRHTLLSFVATIAVIAAVPALAAEIETSSQVDAVTVYPDGATVTRLIRLDLPAGDSTLLARDFPLTLDPSSLRVEGAGGARLVIGAVEARQPQLQPAENIPQIDRRLEALCEGGVAC